MKKLLLTLLGLVVVVVSARAGTVYERTTLEHVVETGEPFTFFASGPIKHEVTGQWSLVWLTKLSDGSSGTAAAVPYSGTYNPEKFHEGLLFGATTAATSPVEDTRPALMTLEAAGEQYTYNNIARDVYYMTYTNRYNPAVTYYVGIPSTNGIYRISTSKVTNGNNYKIYIEEAENYWTAPDGSVVSSDTPYRISAMGQSGVGAMLHYQPGTKKFNFGVTAVSAIPTTNEPQNFHFLDFYRLISTKEQICGTGGEESYSLQVGLGQTIPAPTFSIKVISEDGVPVTPYVVDGNDKVTYKYEIVEGSNVLSIGANGSFTGIGEGTARVRVTLSDASAKYFDIDEPYYVNVTVSNFIPMTLTRVDNPADLSATDVVVFVSARPFTDGQGFVAARNDNHDKGFMYSRSVLPGFSAAPAEMVLPVSTVNDLRQFCLPTASGATTNILMQNIIVNNIKVTVQDEYEIRHLSSGGYGDYAIIDVEGPGYLPRVTRGSNYHLGFYNGQTPSGLAITAGNLCHISESNKDKAVPMYFYKLSADKLAAQIETAGEIILDPVPDQTANVNALLKSVATNGELAVAEGATLTYQVVDANGVAFAAGQAPISVDADGNITVLKPGQARVKVTVGGDYARYFTADAAYCDVIVRTPVWMFIDGISEDKSIDVYAGQSITIPAPTISTNEDGTSPVTDASFIYMLATDDGEEHMPWYDGEGNPVTSNDILSVDPATGVVSTNKGVYGDYIYLIPAMTPETAKYYVLNASTFHLLYNVSVIPPVEAEITYEGGDNNTAYIDGAAGATLPVPVVLVEGIAAEGVTYKYTIIDPTTGEPYADGEAPISIDADGNIVAVNGKSGIAKILVELSDESALQYTAPAIEYVVTVAASAPTTPTGPFATEYVRIKTREELKVGEGFIMVSTDARNKKLTWLTGFSASTGFGTTDSVAVLSSTVLPDKLPAAWFAQSTAPVTMHLAPIANKYYIYFYNNGQKNYMNGTGGKITVTTTPQTGFTIGAQKISKPEHGNDGFEVYPGQNKTMFATEAGKPINLSNNNSNNVAQASRAYPEFYRVVYEPTRFTLEAGSHADLYKLVGTTLTKVETLAEGENEVDMMADTEARVYYIVPTDKHNLAGIEFPDGTSVSEGFEDLGLYGLVCDGYKIEIGRTYRLYTVSTAPRPVAEVTVDGEPNATVNINNGTEGATVPAPALRDADGNAIEEGVTFVYEVVDADGNPFAEGEAPISVDADGNITVLKPGQAFVKVSLTGDAVKLYDAQPATYEVNVTTPVKIELTGDATSVILPEGTTDAAVPDPALKGADGNAIEGEISYVYEVVDADGNPFAEGEAPISVDADGNITVLKPGQAFVKVSLSGDDAKRYGAEPVMYEVSVPEAAEIGYAGDNDDAYVNLGTGASTSAPVPVVTVDGTPVEGLTYKYTVIDPATGEPYADGEAPVIVNPETGEITAVQGKSGFAKIVVELSDESAKLYTAPAIEYVVAVAAPTPATATGPFATEYVRVDNLDEVKSGERFIMVSTDARNKKLTWLTGFGGNPVYGTTDSVAVLNDTVLPTKLPLSWFTTAPRTLQIATTTNPGKYNIYFYDNGAKSYLAGNTGEIELRDAATYQYTINATMTVKEVHGNAGFDILGKYKMMFATEGDKPTILSHNNNNNAISFSRAYPAFYRAVYEPTRFTLEAGSHADLYKLVNGTMIKVETLTESGTSVNLADYPDANEFFIVPTDHNNLTSVEFTDGNSVTDGFESLVDHGMQGHGYKIVFGATYASYVIATEMPDATPAQITLANGSTGGSVNIPAGKTGESIPSPVLTDDKDEPIEGQVTFKYTVIDPTTGEPFAEGEAPITVDENGNITTVDGKTGKAQVVVTLSDESAKIYNAEPVIYDVNVTKPDVVAGINGEQAIDLQLGNGKETDLPEIKLTTVDNSGSVVPVEGVTYTYEVINPANGEVYDPSVAPVTVDPATGKVTATDNSGEAQIKVTANGYDAEPLYIDVNVKDFHYVTLQRITDVSTIKAGDPVVMVSSRPISGKGFVSSSSDTESLGIETGTTGNMPPVSILPGQTTLPDELVLTTEQADALRTFSIVSNGTGYGFQIKNGVKFGTGQYIRSEKNDRIRYLNSQVIGYELTPKAEGAYAPKLGNFYLSFNASGILTSFTSTLSNDNGADIVFYSVLREKTDATLEFENGTTRETVKIPEGAAGTTVPTPTLVDTDDEPIEGVTFKYEIVDPKTGKPFADGEAPISVDPVTGEITTLKEGDAKIVVSLSDESAAIYDVETPIEYVVSVTPSTVITGINGEDNVDIQIGNGKEIDLPEVKITTVDENGDVKDVEGVTFKYEVIDPATGQPFADGKAPVTVDPATGKVTATDNSGEAWIKVTAEGNDNVAPMFIDVNVGKYDYVKFELVTDLSTLKEDDVVVFVSSKAVNGKGYVASSHHVEAGGVHVGTTGNMAPISVIPGSSALPAVLELTTEKADSIRQFNVLTNGTHYGFYIVDQNKHVKAERNNRVRYHANEFVSYQMIKVGPAQAHAMFAARAAEAPAAWAPTSGNLTLGYNAAGVLTHGSTNNNIVMYKVSKPVSAELKSNLEGDSFQMDQQETKELPTPTLMVDGEEVPGVTYTYTVVDENGQPFADGMAPITVDPETGVVTAISEGTAKVIVSLSDKDAELYNAEPLEYMFTVTDQISSVIDVETAAADDAMYFNLSGMRVKNPQPGIYIRVKGNTKTKVMIK